MKKGQNLLKGRKLCVSYFARAVVFIHKNLGFKGSFLHAVPGKRPGFRPGHQPFDRRVAGAPPFLRLVYRNGVDKWEKASVYRVTYSVMLGHNSCEWVLCQPDKRSRAERGQG